MIITERKLFWICFAIGATIPIFLILLGQFLAQYFD